MNWPAVTHLICILCAAVLFALGKDTAGALFLGGNGVLALGQVTAATVKKGKGRAAGAVLLSLGIGALSSCTGLSPTRVAAERARQAAVAAAVADGAVDADELALLQTLCVTWDAKLQQDEASLGQPTDAKSVLLRIFEVYGAALLQSSVGPDLQQRFPEAYAYIDRAPKDGLISIEELRSLDPLDPVFALVLVTTVTKLRE